MTDTQHTSEGATEGTTEGTTEAGSQPGSVRAPRAPQGPTAREERANLVRLGLVVALAIGLAVSTGAFPTVVVLVAILLMIMLHELGHFVMAKWAGMKVTEFFLGFGPRLWSTRRGETEYGVKAIPAGGYVRIVGMHNLEQVDPSDEPRAYRQQPFWRRLSVALAGSTMHFLIAFVLLLVLLAGFGSARIDRWDVGSITKLSTGEAPARDAGFRLGDKVVTIDGRRIRSWEEVRAYVRARPGEDVTFGVERDGKPVRLTATLARRNPEGERVGFLGVGPHFPLVRNGPVTAVGRSAKQLGSLTVGSVKALGSFFTPSSLRDYSHQLTGEPSKARGEATTGRGGGENRFLSPVGASRIASQAAKAGVAEVLELLVLINVFVGIFNLVPLLPLDGGHVAIAAYERIRSRRGRRYHADVAKLMPLTYAVVLVLVTLGATALWLDIVRPLANPFQ